MHVFDLLILQGLVIVTWTTSTLSQQEVGTQYLENLSGR